MKEIENSSVQKADSAQKTETKRNNEELLLELLKRSTAVYNHVIQGKLLDANDIQRINSVFLSMLILNEKSYFENAIKRKELEKDKFDTYIKMRHKFIAKQLELMLKDLETKLLESRDKKEQTKGSGG